MRIMYISANAGGILKYIKELSSKIDATQAVIFSENHKEMVEKDLTNIDNKIYLNMKEGRNILDNIRLINDIKKAVKSFNPDIVYIHGSRISFVSRIALMGFKNIKIIFNPHGWNFSNKFNIFFEKFFAKYTDMIINTSEKELKLAESKGITPRIGMYKINNGIDFERYEELYNNKEEKEAVRKEIREKLNIDEFQKAVVQVGNITPKRDPFIFLSACLALIKMGYNIKVIMIGDGDKEYINKIMEFAETNNMLDKIEITGWVDNLADYLISMDIAVSTVKNENTPITLAEYMASKLSIVSNNAEINAEILDYGKFGRIVSSGDMEDYVHQMQEIFMDDPKDMSMKESTYRYAKENYNLNKMVEKHKEVFIILCDEESVN